MGHRNQNTYLKGKKNAFKLFSKLLKKKKYEKKKPFFVMNCYQYSSMTVDSLTEEKNTWRNRNVELE